MAGRTLEGACVGRRTDTARWRSYGCATRNACLLLTLVMYESARSLNDSVSPPSARLVREPRSVAVLSDDVGDAANADDEHAHSAATATRKSPPITRTVTRPNKQTRARSVIRAIRAHRAAPFTPFGHARFRRSCLWGAQPPTNLHTCACVEEKKSSAGSSQPNLTKLKKRVQK